MNKFTITICALCMLCISCTSSSQVNYIIKGMVNDMNGKKVYLHIEEPETWTVIDSTIVSNNTFTFKGTKPKACVAHVTLQRRSSSLFPTVILENGTINVSFDNPQKVTGTPMNDILSVCYDKIFSLHDEFYAFAKQRDKLKENQKDEIAALNKKIDENINETRVVVKECIKQNLDNIIGAYLLDLQGALLSNNDIIEILNNASPLMQESSFVQKDLAYKKAWERTEIGQKFTDVKMKDVNDKDVALSDYIGKGKYVLIEFWASGCGACREEMPHLKAIYEKFASKGFEIVGISLDARKENWLKAIKDLEITWPQMSDLKAMSEGSKLYGIRFIPTIFLVDTNGIIIARNLEGDAIEKKLEEVLK